jgi:hypothetical protein
MGIVSSTVTQQQLIAYQSDLERDILAINQAKLNLSSSMTDLLNAGTDLDPDNPMVKQLEQRKERLHLLEKNLDMQLNDKQTKLSMVKKNLDKAKEMAG